MARQKRPPPAGAALSADCLSTAPSEILTLEEAAALAKCGLECWRSLVDLGEVPAVKLNGKHTILLREDVIDFLRTKARHQAEERRKGAQLRPSRRRRTPMPDLRRHDR